MLKEILESSGKVYEIKKIGGEDLEDIYDDVCGSLTNEILQKMIERFQDEIGDDIVKRGQNMISLIFNDKNYLSVKPYTLKIIVEDAVIFDPEGEERDASESEISEFIDFIQNCKYLGVEENDYGDCVIIYNKKALDHYPKYI
jgi:hypothetical protein